MINKEPKTYAEQIEILKSRGLVISDEKNALSTLSSINYYSISGYLHNFKDKDGTYSGNLSFEKVIKIMQCDRRMKSIIKYALDLIENNLKTKMAYILAHEIGSTGYLERKNYKDKDEYDILNKKFQNSVRNNKKLPFVVHHNEKYNGVFPIWVAVELFTMGMISNMYKNLDTRLQKLISLEFRTGVNQLSSWIENITYIRNLSAHNMRIYGFALQKQPKKCKNNFDEKFRYTSKVFDEIYVMKFLYGNKNEWNHYIIPSIQQILLEYEEYIDLNEYGFDENWDSLLIIK